MRHAVIMAGGSGTRLWPLSRRMRPKQLLRLFDGASLIELARERLEGLFEPENIWVITSANYIDQVADALPDLPRANLIGEPMGRDTANAIGLAAHLLARRDPDGTMAVFTADHIISPRAAFAQAIRAGLDAAEQHADSLITFGITPDSPHTGYGYVRRGEALGPAVFRAAEFKEKPSREVAEAYLKSGEYLWNSGMFAWRVSAILAELERNLAQNAAKLASLAEAWERMAGSDECAERFGSLDRISIDYGVMEKARSVLLVEMKCKWLDLGSWTAIAATRESDEAGNALIAERALVENGRNNILVSESDHLIVALGVSDLVVVHSADATLVCHRDHVQAIRDLAAAREQRFGERYE
ncbi:MAG: NTP transferase domain-containing protein [Planctomycetes bacterium]|nr:NTP transferase domain-containing protein [Planctomycetota bacterium]